MDASRTMLQDSSYAKSDPKAAVSPAAGGWNEGKHSSPDRSDWIFQVCPVAQKE